MEFTGQEMTFEEADRRYADLRRRRDAGAIGNEEFDAERQHLMVRDGQGVWWAKGREANEWFYRADTGWVPGMPPPPYQPPRINTGNDTGVTTPTGLGDGNGSGPGAAVAGTSAGRSDVPPEVGGWNWGAFLLGWIWAAFNVSAGKAVLSFVLSLFLGIIWNIVLGVKGGEWSWRDKRWNSVGEFQRTQRKWTRAGVIVLVVSLLLSVLFVIFAIVAGLFAAGSEPTPQPTPDDQNEPAPEPDPAPTVSFRDDFSDPSSGWPTDDTEAFTTAYADGSYQIINPPPPGTVTSLVSAVEAQGLTDTRIEASASLIEAPDPGETVSAWGLACRAADENNYYGLGIGSDGSFRIYKMTDGSATDLATGEANGAVNMDTSTDQISAECVGSTMTLFVNGQNVLEAQDSEFASGDVGVFVNNVAEEEPGTEITFDDFEVSEP